MSKVLVNINEAQNHRKFYEVKVVGSVVKLHWGRIGTRGQKQVHEFGDKAEACAFAADKVFSKLGRGYVVVK